MPTRFRSSPTLTHTGSQSVAVHAPRARRVGGLAGGLRQRKCQGEREWEGEGNAFYLPSASAPSLTRPSPPPQVPTTPYALTPLTGIKFSITGGRSAAKDALAARLTAAGATYTATLTKTCTHLLVLKDDPPPGTAAGTTVATRTVSAKERAAREWRQRVVWGEAWGGAVLGPRGYDRSVDADAAVPPARSSTAPAPTPASAAATAASLQAPAARPAAARPAPAAPRLPPPPPPPFLIHIPVAPGDPDAMFLDGARIALTSTRDAGERVALLGVVRAGGATFERFLHPSVTHAVVGSDPSPDEADALRAHTVAHPGATAIVGVSWLAACAAERRIVEAGPHAVDVSTLARGAPLSGHHFTLAALAHGDGAADAASTIVRAGGRTFDGRTARGVPPEGAWAVCPPGLPAATAASLTASHPDFAMVPPTHRVTQAWLAASVAAGRPVATPPPPRTLSAARGVPPVPPLAPLPHALPLPDFAEGRVVLCGSGLSAAARASAAALGAVLGARWRDTMTAATTHLLTRGRTGEKYARAGEYGVVPVTPDWLTACAVAGGRVEEHEFHPPESGGEPAARVAAAAAAPSPAPPAAAATPSSVASRGGGSGRGGRRMSGLELSAVARAAVGVPSPAVASAPPPPPSLPRRTPAPDAGGTPLAAFASRPPGETPVAASSRVAAAATPRALSAAAASPVAAAHPPPPPPPPPSADRPELRAAFDALDAAIGSRAGGGGASRLGGGGRAATAAPAAAGSTPPSARTRRRLRTAVAPLPHDDSQNSDPTGGGGGGDAAAPPGRKRARRAAVASSAPSLGVPSSLPPPPPDCSQLVAYDAGAAAPSPPLGGDGGAPPGRRRRDRGAPPSAEARRALVRAVTRRGAGATDVLAEMGLM